MIEQYRNEIFEKLMSRNYADVCGGRIRVQALQRKFFNWSKPFLLIFEPYIGSVQIIKSLKGEQFVDLSSLFMTTFLRLPST